MGSSTLGASTFGASSFFLFSLKSITVVVSISGVFVGAASAGGLDTGAEVELEVVVVEPDEVEVVEVTAPFDAGTLRSVVLVVVVVVVEAGVVVTEVEVVPVVLVVPAEVVVLPVPVVVVVVVVEGEVPVVAMSEGVPNNLVSSTKAAIG